MSLLWVDDRESGPPRASFGMTLVTWLCVGFVVAALLVPMLTRIWPG